MDIKKLVLREHNDNGMNDFRVEGVRGNVSLWKDYNKEGDCCIFEKNEKVFNVLQESEKNSELLFNEIIKNM